MSHSPAEVAAAEVLTGLQPRALVVLVDQVIRAPRDTRVYAVTSHADVWAVARGASFHLDGSHAVLANEAEALALTGAPNAGTLTAFAGAATLAELTKAGLQVGLTPR